MEQQTIRIRQILNTFPKAALIEMLLTQEIDEPRPQYSVSEPIEEPTLFTQSSKRYKRSISNAPTSRRRWTKEQDEALIYAIKQGRKSYTEIGHLIGRTNKAIQQRATILRSRGLL